MKLKLTCLLCVLSQMFFAFSALGATRDDDVVIIKQQPKAVFANSSEHNRIGKTIVLTGQLFGGGPSASSGQGATVGFHLDRNRLVQFEALWGGTGNLFYLVGGKTTVRSAGVHFKHFVGNSFYYRTGLEYKTVDYNYNYTFVYTNGYDRESFSGNALGAAVVIGNQWQWENFVLGCDWIGITAPFTSQVTAQESSSSLNGSSSSESTSLYSYQDRLLKEPYFHFLRFFLGASF